MARRLGDAPGLEWKRVRDRRTPRWRARKSAVKLGYRPSVVNLAADPNDTEAIAALCHVEQQRMEAWLRDEKPASAVFNGTLGSLIQLYATDPDSPYRDLKYSTQQAYDSDLKILENTVGQRRVDKLSGADFRRWYNNLKKPAQPGGPERLRRAHGVMTTLRIVLGYGRAVGMAHCGTLREVMSAMRFKSAPPRRTVMTYDQAVIFIAKAHELGFPEMALGQALQFEGTLRQIDIIGEWVPDPEIRARQRWTTGLVWQDLRDFVLIKSDEQDRADGGD
jgi:hypothetical protein